MTAIPALLHAAKVLALALVIIAVFVLVLWLIGVLVDGRRLRHEARVCHQRRVEDYEREKRMAETLEDTRPYPPDFPEGGAFC